MSEYVKAIDLLRGYMADGDWRAAIKLAATWQQLGDEKRAITQAWEALRSPRSAAMYRSMGKDPDAIVAEGVAALKRRYGVP